MATADCIKLNELISKNEKAVRELNENARQFAFKSILNIVNELYFSSSENDGIKRKKRRND